MIVIIGIVAVIVIILDGWTNKFAICKAVGALFKNTWVKVTGGR